MSTPQRFQPYADDISQDMPLLRPPIVRSATGVLDRSLFSKTVPIAAARIFSNKNITKIRTQLEKSKDVLVLERIKTVRPDPDAALASKGSKCLLLNPEVKPEGMRQAPCDCLEGLISSRFINMEPNYTRSSEGRAYWNYTLLTKFGLQLLGIL
jgi:hypothetical protein